MSFLANDWDEAFLENIFRCSDPGALDLSYEYGMAKKEHEECSGQRQQLSAQGMHDYESRRELSDSEI